MDTNEDTAGLVNWAIMRGRIGFSLQNITAVADTSETLYAECLGRLVLPEDIVLTVEEFAEDVEAAGCAAAFDRHMLSLAAEWLSHHPTGVLGCDVSVTSILDECGRHSLLDILRSSRQIADRLVLELTINRPVETHIVIRKFCREARALGYRIALDRFGADHSPADILMAFAFDIVKIDSVFPVVGRDNRARPLHQLVGLASGFAPVVVVAGVETYAQLDTAHLAGVTHVQGYLLSEPTLAPVFGYQSSLPSDWRGIRNVFH